MEKMMELELVLIDAEGNVRTIIVTPGEPVDIQPGEMVLVSPEVAAAMTISRDGSTLQIRIPNPDGMNRQVCKRNFRKPRLACVLRWVSTWAHVR